MNAASCRFADERTILVCLMVGPLLAGVGIWQEHSQPTSGRAEASLAAVTPTGARRAELLSLRQELRKLENENLNLRAAYAIPASIPEGVAEGDRVDIVFSAAVGTVPHMILDNVLVVGIRDRSPSQVALALTDEQAQTLDLAQGTFSLIARNSNGASDGDSGELFAER